MEPQPAAPPPAPPPAATAPLAPPAPLPPSAPVPEARPGVGLAGTRAVLVLAGLGALAFGASSAWAQWLGGHTLTPLATLAGGLGLFALLAAGGLFPERMARVAHAPGIARSTGLAAFALVSFAFVFVFGVGALLDTAGTLEQLASGQGLGSTERITRTGLLFSLAINFLLFTVPVLAWAAYAELRPGQDGRAWLGLTTQGAKASVLWAMVSVALVFWVLIAAGLANNALGNGNVENARAEAIGAALDVPSVILVAALTGIGEELFFRGFLLKKLGNAPQAILFGLAHLNYVQVLEVVLTAGMGYLFGRTVRRTGSVLGPILGHATFNAISLFIILYKGSGSFPAWLPALPFGPF